MRTWPLRAFLLALLLTASPSFAANIEALQVLEVGLFRARTMGQSPAPQAVGESTNIIENVVFYESTTKVPARQGIRFGIRFRLVGAPAGQRVPLRIVWRIPEPGIQDPRTGTLYRDGMMESIGVIGEDSMSGYSFDEPWEIRCGNWVQEIWFGQRKLHGQTFTVEDCQGIPTSSREPRRCDGNSEDVAACRAG